MQPHCPSLLHLRNVGASPALNPSCMELTPFPAWASSRRAGSIGDSGIYSTCHRRQEFLAANPSSHTRLLQQSLHPLCSKNFSSLKQATDHSHWNPTSRNRELQPGEGALSPQTLSQSSFQQTPAGLERGASTKQLFPLDEAFPAAGGRIGNDTTTRTI